MSFPIDSRFVALFRFDEKENENRPVDEVGTVADLFTETGLTMPAVADAVLGSGRAFTISGATGLLGADANDTLVLTRNMSIMVALAPNTAAIDTGGDPATIVWHNRGNNCFGIRLVVSDFANDEVLVKAVWHDGTSEVEDTGVYVTWPNGEEFLLTVIREIEGDTFKIVYVVNGEVATSISTPAIAVDDTITGANLYVGVEPDGASNHVNHFEGTISYLGILNEAIAAEEALQSWDFISKDIPQMKLALAKTMPPGAFSTDETSWVQKELDVDAAAVALARNVGRGQRDYYFPGESIPENLDHWEKLTNRRRFARDSIDDRQTRIESYLQGAYGYATNDLKTQMLEFLGYTDVADIDVITYSATRTEDFTAASTPGAAAAIIEEGNATLTVTSNLLRMAVTAGDVQFGNGVAAPYHLWSLSGRDRGHRDQFFGCHMIRNTLPADVFGGLMIGRRDTREYWFIGQYNDGAGDDDIVYFTYSPTAGLSAVTVVEGTWDEDDTYLRLRHKTGGAYDVQYGTSDAAAQAQTPTELTGLPLPDYVGFAMVAIGNASVTATVDFNSWYAHEVSGLQPLNYYLYRDPADPGEYDVEGANRLLQQVGPAHYQGRVIDDLTAACDDDTTYDREPMGL